MCVRANNPNKRVQFERDVLDWFSSTGKENVILTFSTDTELNRLLQKHKGRSKKRDITTDRKQSHHLVCLVAVGSFQTYHTIIICDEAFCPELYMFKFQIFSPPKAFHELIHTGICINSGNEYQVTQSKRSGTVTKWTWTAVFKYEISSSAFKPTWMRSPYGKKWKFEHVQ